MTSLNKNDRNKIGMIKSKYSELLSKKEKFILILYICLYIIYSISVIPRDILLAIIAIVFLVAPLKGTLIMYLFFTIWENVTIFSFGITLSLVLQIIMAIKIIIYLTLSKKTIFYKVSDIVILVLCFFYGAMDYLIGTGGLSGFSLAINVLIVLYAYSIYRNDNQSFEFWKTVCFILMISTIIAIVYGIFNDTSLDRWITGMGYVKQLYGTIGTARMGMFLCASLIYPVFYLDKKIPRLILCVILSLCALLTFSITTLICLMVFWGAIILFKDKKNITNKIVALFIFFVGLIIIIILWDRIKEIDIIRPMAIRVESMITAFKGGDMGSATSSRSYLAKIYFQDFQQYSLFNQIFGSFYINRFEVITGFGWDVSNYAHNSFIDLLLYSGVFGLIIFFIKTGARIKNLKGKKEFLPVLLLKSIFLLTGLSVSMLTSSYWLVWMII